MSVARARDRTGILAVLAAERGVAILPTDTLPGLHARLDRPLAVAELARIKGRDAAKPFLILADSAAWIQTLCLPVSGAVSVYLETIWPGPFTAILGARPGLPAGVASGAGTVAVRVPSPPLLRDLLAESGPLASTSANPAGTEPAVDMAAATAWFPDLPWWKDAVPAGAGQASALVDLTGGEPRLLRPGPLALPAWDADLS